MASQVFKSKRTTGHKTVNGVGSFTVDIDFEPNFLEVTFGDIKHKKTTPNDSRTWDLATTPTGYQLTINYNCGEERTLRWVIAKLPVNPEQTISF